jgi:N6-adenosine-specific RNA methylase IME4
MHGTSGRARGNPAALLRSLAAKANAEARAAEEHHQQSKEHARRCGEALIRAKALVPHGEWGQWLRANFERAARTARLYMQLAQMPAEEWQRVADLPFPLRDTVKIISEMAESYRNARVAAQRVVIPDGKFETFGIDYPLPMQRGGVPDGCTGWCHPTMSLDQIKTHVRETVRPLIADHAHSFWWTPQKFVPFTFDLLKEAELEYGFMMVWDKGKGPQAVGLPCFNNEFIVYARRGRPKFATTKQFRTCFFEKPREQCRKPDVFYNMVRRATAGPRIDMFSREKRQGFEQHGNEIDKFAEAAE